MSNFDDAKIPHPFNTIYGVSIGTFYYRKDGKLCANHCRESFHSSRKFLDNVVNLDMFIKSNGTDVCPFWFGTQNSKNMADCFHFLEEKLGLSTRTKFTTTKQDFLVKIDPSPFWCAIAAKFSIFTCFVKGFNYCLQHGKLINDEQFFNHTMTNYGYLKETRHNLVDFLNRNTFYDLTNVTSNWVSNFKASNFKIWLNPREFTHEIYQQKVSRRAKEIWNKVGQPKKFDLPIWLMAEKIEAANAMV